MSARLEMFNLNDDVLQIQGFLRLRSDVVKAPARPRAISDPCLRRMEQDAGRIQLQEFESKCDCQDTSTVASEAEEESAERSSSSSDLGSSDSDAEGVVVGGRPHAEIACSLPVGSVMMLPGFFYQLMSVQPCFVIRTKASKESALDTSVIAVMLRNVPNNLTRAGLMDILDSSGFTGCYDFLYLPMDFRRGSNFGYAFVALINRMEALRFRDTFHGFASWPGHESSKVGEVQWSTTSKNAEDYVERYRNSPMMHDDIPEECRPLLLQGGIPVTFPPPTKALKKVKKAKRICLAAAKAQRQA